MQTVIAVHRYNPPLHSELRWLSGG